MLICHIVVSVNTEQHIHKVCMNIVDRSSQTHTHTSTQGRYAGLMSSGKELSPYQSMNTDLEKAPGNCV